MATHFGADADLAFEPRLTPNLTLVALALGGAFLWLLTHRVGAPNATLLALGFLIELASPRLGNFGFFSVSTGIFLAAALQAPAATGFVLVLALILRTLFRSQGGFSQRILELLSDLFPSLMALIFLVFLQHMEQVSTRVLLSGLGALLVWWFTPGLFQGALETGTFLRWTRSRERLLFSTAAQLSCGIILSLHKASWFLAVPMALVFLALADSARRVAYQVQALYEQSTRQKAEVHISQERRELGKNKVHQELAEAQLEVQMESYRLIEKMLSSLRHSPSLKSIALAVLEQVRTRVPCTSVALYLQTNSSLRIVAAITPHQDRIQSIPILGLSEALVERAWQRGKVQTLDSEEALDPLRVFTSDVSAIAAPISDQGVIYVGNQQPHKHSELELQYLESLSRHSWLALQAAKSQEEQQTAYKGELEARQASEMLLNRLADLVAGMNRLLHLSDPKQLVKAGALLMQELFKTPATWARFSDTEENHLQGPLEGIQELIQSSIKARRPILHSEYQKSPFFRPGSPYQCVLVVPLMVQQQEAGFLLAASQEIFGRDDQDMLSLLALQFGPILQTVRLYADLQVAHEQLRESQAKLIQSSKMAAIGQLAGGVAHEINTPLGAVTVSIDAVAMYLETKPEKSRERLDKARNACVKMKNIISKLLFYSRDSANRKERSDLNQVVRDTLDFIGSQIRLENIEIETQLSPLPLSSVNQNEIQQILINLLNNAKDAVLGEGASQRRIEIQSLLDGKDCVIRVRDYGPGVPSDKAASIFDPFYTTKPVGQGTGLGLAVSLQLAEQHEGSLSLLTHSGPGALFELRLPQVSTTEVAEE